MESTPSTIVQVRAPSVGTYFRGPSVGTYFRAPFCWDLFEEREKKEESVFENGIDLESDERSFSTQRKLFSSTGEPQL